MTITVSELKLQIINKLWSLIQQLEDVSQSEGLKPDRNLGKVSYGWVKAELHSGIHEDSCLELPVKRKYRKSGKWKMMGKPRNHLKNSYVGLSVSSAVALAAVRMGSRSFTAKDIGEEIYDYRGVRRVTGLHSGIHSAFYTNSHISKLENGRHVYSEKVSAPGTFPPLSTLDIRQMNNKMEPAKSYDRQAERDPEDW